MATMIPRVIAADTKSAAERRIFERLSGEPGMEGWTILHSLGLARRQTGPHGEIDFVVVIPEKGIICIEVKGGRVTCNEGIWQTMNRYGEVARLPKSPFMQARDAMFGLKNLIAEHFGSESDAARCPMTYVVAFPDVSGLPSSPEFERGEVIDADDLRGPLSSVLGSIAHARLGAVRRQGQGPNPTPKQARALIGFLRPSFDLVPSRAVAMDRIEETLIGLTEEQYERLDELADNPRCLFRGSAGTGKTLLALEYARRADASGARVALVCYNRLLASWLGRQVHDTGIEANTWYEILKTFIASGPTAKEFERRETEAFQQRRSTGAL